MGLHVDQPWALLLLLPVALFVWLMVRGTMRLTGLRRVSAITVRVLILVLLIAIAAGVTPYQRTEQRNVIFVADRSASLGSDEVISKWVQEAIDSKSERDRAAVVSFGLHAAVERALTEEQAGAFALRTEVNRSFSQISGGLQLAGGMLPDGGRLVLLSDGEENAGDLLKQGRRLRDQGIAVDVVYLPKRTAADAALESLRVPSSLKLGEKFVFEIAVTSTFAGEAELRLYEDNAEKANVIVQLEAGENRFALQSIANEPGFHRYRAEIYAAGDRQARNNAAYAFSRVDGPPRVLVVEGAANSSGNIASALQASFIPYDVVLPEQLPVELADYARYDSLILNNVPATRIAEAPMRNVEAAVADYGIGLVAIGGKDSYGLGGYYKTPIEKALPVYMDLKGKRQLPSLGLILVIDKSGSMDGGKLELAKEAALRTVELLREQDTVGVIAFDGSPWWVVEPVQLSDRDQVMNAIRGIQPSGGTEIYSAVEAGLNRMLDVQAQRRHIILLTDGQSGNRSGYGGLTATMRENDITMSTVAVGDGADTALLESLARDAQGRYYFTNDQSTIPAIFSRETTMMSRTYIVENRFTPAVGQAGDWAGWLSLGLPAVDAYVATTPKETAEQVLVTPLGDPLLARWQYGSGRTVAWTSDLTGQWAKDWAAWDGMPDAFAQWVKWTFPQFTGEPYEVAAEWQGGEAKLRIRESSGDGGSADDLRAVVTDERGRRSELTPIPVAPGEYEAQVGVEGPGAYLTQIGGSLSGFVIPYSPEYRVSDAGGREKLEQLAAITGGRMLMLEQPEAAFEGPRTVTKQFRDVTRPLLILALLLWLMDIAIRRLSIPWARLGAYVGRLLSSRSVKRAGGSASSAAEAALGRLQARRKQDEDWNAGTGRIGKGEQAPVQGGRGGDEAQVSRRGGRSDNEVPAPLSGGRGGNEAQVSRRGGRGGNEVTASARDDRGIGTKRAGAAGDKKPAKASERVLSGAAGANADADWEAGKRSPQNQSDIPSNAPAAKFGKTNSQAKDTSGVNDGKPADSIGKLLEAKRRKNRF